MIYRLRKSWTLIAVTVSLLMTMVVPAEAQTTNLAAGKPVTGSIGIQNAAFITNGDKNTANYAGLEVGAQWIQIDLGQVYTLNQIKVWHYFGDGRTYRDVIVKVSTSASFSSGVTTVFNNDTNNSAGQGTGSQAEYAETSAGKSITFTPVAARYVRLWTNGSTSNQWNHYVEVEVYGSGGTGPTATSTRTNTSVPPTSTPTTSGSGCYAAWISNITYPTGSRVTYNSMNYQANYPTNGDNPAQHSGPAGSGQPWLTLGPCNPATATVTNTPLPTFTPCPSCPTATLPADAILWDDFNYSGPSDPLITQRNWILRSVQGGPGVAGATWAGNVTFVNDPANSNNRLMQLSASTDGTAANTKHAEIYHQRKFYEGTYAARVFFTDAPESGPDGENIVETFFTITPLNADMDPNYGELDFEYLPNGGWGAQGPIMYMTTWETYQNQPWQSVNINTNYTQSFAGWHTLVMQVANGEVKYYIDGALMATHGGIYYPETPMSINFNLWFITLQGSSTPRQYKQNVDWVFFVKDQVLTPAQVDGRVTTYRTSNVKHIDTVPNSGLPGIPNN
jgi:hypothetical protein